MAKELTDLEKQEELDNLIKDFNIFDCNNVEVLIFKNPVLNALFNGSKDKGGFAIGSVAQIAAESGAGKTTLALNICREVLFQGKKVLYIDAEGGLNENQLESTGVKNFVVNKQMLILRENDCQQINEFLQKISKHKLYDFVILDSLGALDSGIYKIDGGNVNINNPKVGADTKSTKALMKNISAIAMKDKISFILINHVAKDLGSYIPTNKPTGRYSFSIFI